MLGLDEIMGAGPPKMGLSSLVEEMPETLSPGHANTPQVSVKAGKEASPEIA